MSDLELIEDLKIYLKDYIVGSGREIRTKPGGIEFKCLCHSPDNNPSMYIGSKIPVIAHCWSCQANISIYHAHHLLEGAPLYGRDFIEKNVNVLAVKYGREPLLMSDLSEDQLHKLNLYQIHDAIYTLLAQNDKRIANRDLCKAIGISDEIAIEMGIGTITSYDKLIDILQHLGRWSIEDLQNAGIRSSLFGPSKLTHTIHDRKGRPIAFASRDYRVDGKFGHKQQNTEIDRRGIERPIPKWSNSTTSPIYEKVNTLYGYHRLRKTEGVSSVYVVEGYNDAAIMWSYGLDNVVCIGSTALVPQHLLMVRDAGKEIITILMDNDDSGKEAVDRILESNLQIPSIKLEIMLIPQDPKHPSKVIDPDDFIKANGVEAFSNLYRMSAFEYKINRIPTQFESDNERDIFVRNFLPVIMGETSSITQASMRNILARKTGLPEPIIREYQENLEKAHSIETREIIRKEAKKFFREFEDVVNFKPQESVLVISDFKDKVNDRINSASLSKLSLSETVESYSQWKKDRYTANVDNMFWKTGWKYFDNVLGGIQKSDVLWAFSAGPNLGKSSILTNIALGLLQNNSLDELCLMYWTIDDPRETLYTKLISLLIREPYYKVFLTGTQTPDIRKKIEKGMNQFDSWLRNGNFIAKGIEIGKDANAVIKWVEAVRRQYPTRKQLLIIDNFNNMGGHGEELEVQARNIEALQDLRSTMSTLAAFEVNKEGFGGRAEQKNVRGTAKISFRITRNFLIYNEVKDVTSKMGTANSAKHFWYDAKGEKQPILEANIGKTKNMSPGGSVGGTQYYQFVPDMGLLTEIGGVHKFREFQILNNQQKQFTDPGLVGWQAYDGIIDAPDLTATEVSDTQIFDDDLGSTILT